MEDSIRATREFNRANGWNWPRKTAKGWGEMRMGHSEKCCLQGIGTSEHAHIIAEEFLGARFLSLLSEVYVAAKKATLLKGHYSLMEKLTADSANGTKFCGMKQIFGHL